MTSIANTETKIGGRRPTTPAFVLRSVIDGRITVNEDLWDQEQLSLRLVKVVPVKGYHVSWCHLAFELWVSVTRQDGLVLSRWKCPQCGVPETSWDLKPTAEMVLGKLPSHLCGSSITTPVGNETGSVAAAAIADVLAEEIDEDVTWEELPSRPVTPDYTVVATELETLEADEAAEVGTGFFDSLVLVDATGVAL